ncbi:hypothetical protein ACIBG7_15140 [Nonomuraea sp. NPDC050328]|uniref:hypothetical protein n=1 Tax=Nonomuraea sp. NPDC050328 TaxID=3364361 RepID=UPI00379C4BB2
MTHPTIETLDWLISYWPDLLDARDPMATRRPWTQSEISPQARAVRDAEARLERLLRTPEAPGETPTPLDISVLQTALDITVRADDLQAELANALGRPPHPPLRHGALGADVRCQRIRGYLIELGTEWQDWAAPTVHAMYEQAARALGMAYTGQVIPVLCPWCNGRTPETPAGGAQTWRVVDMPNAQVAIVCQGLCDPPADQVGAWWRGQPCWPIGQWEALAKRLPEGVAQRVQRLRRVMRRRAGVVHDDVIAGLLTEDAIERLAKLPDRPREVGDVPAGGSGRA